MATREKGWQFCSDCFELARDTDPKLFFLFVFVFNQFYINAFI